MSLCANCRNAETGYQYNGHTYTPTDVCVYEMTYFPRAKSCAKFEAIDGLESEDKEAA